MSHSHPGHDGDRAVLQHGHHPRSGDAGHGASRPAAPHGAHSGPPGAHDKHAGHRVAMLRDKFWISLALTAPTLVWGHMLPRALG